MTIKKPWRWTRMRSAIRTLLENGRTVEEITQLFCRSFDKQNPDARTSERAMTHSSYALDVREVAVRIGRCPRCFGEMRENKLHNSLSRRDCETYICPDCGTKEALEDAGMLQVWRGNEYWQGEAR